MDCRRRFHGIVLLALLLAQSCVSVARAADESTSRWIVVYKNSTLKTAALQRRSGLTRHNFRVIPGFAANLTATEVEQLRNDSSVAIIEPDTIRHAIAVRPSQSLRPHTSRTTSSALAQMVPYGIDAVHARDVWQYTKGSGVRIANIDTGIDLSHPDKPSIVGSATFTGASIQDTNGHGTHTSGTEAAPDNGVGVVGVAPEAGLLVAQVFDSKGDAYDSDVIAAIDWAVQNGAHVINMSLGGTDYNASLAQACASAVASGVVVVAAAGNDGTNEPNYPAACPSVISVAAVDHSEQRASFSNYGSTVDLAAPGVGIISTVPVGTGSLLSATWNGIDRETEVLTGSAAGTVTGSVVYCGLGYAADFPASITGKIAHIRRGTLTFREKVDNAVAAGAAGVIISNNTSGEVTGTLSGSTSVVVVAVSQSDGDDLQANEGVTATIVNLDPADYESYEGTSMSSPHVSGVAALLIAARHKQITPAEVTSAMETAAEDLGSSDRDDYYGYGLVNAVAALGEVIPIVQSVSASPTLVAGGSPVTVTVQLSTSTGLSSLTANGTNLTANGSAWTCELGADSALGVHTIDITVADAWGNVNHNTSLTYTTTTALALPAISISGPSASSTTTGPVSYTATYSDATAVTLSKADVSLNTTGTATGTISVSGSGTTTRTITISSITGDGAIGISIAAGSASNSAGSATAAGPSATFSVLNTLPTIAIGAPSASSTTAGPVNYTITYSKADSVTLSTSNVSLNTTGTATGTVSVTGSGTATRTVTISSITGDGTIGISIAAGTAANSAGSTPEAGPSATFSVLNTLPTIAIGTPSASSTTAGPVSYTITYSKADSVTLSKSDVSLNTTGTATGTASVTGSGTATRTVTISSITGDGTIGISIAAGTAANSAGSTPAAGPSATFSVLNTFPTIAIGAPSVSTTAAGPVSFAVTYTGATSVTLSGMDVSLNTTGTATGTVSVSGSGATTRTVTISSITGDGTIGISIAAGTASNAAGPALAVGSSATFTVHNDVPVVAFAFPTSAASVTRNCSNLSISGTASDGQGVAKVQWTLNGASSGTCSGTGNWSATGITLAAGENTLVVTATDTLGGIGTATLMVNYLNATPGDSWQGVSMVSLPIIPDATDPQPIMGFLNGGLCTYDTLAGAYVVYPDARTWFNPTSSTPGRGFWAYFPTTGANTPCGTIPAQNQPKTIHLYAGWNLVGQPFINSVVWDSTAITVVRSGGTTQESLADASDAVAAYAWGWDIAADSYYLIMDANQAADAIHELAPWQSYWLRAYVECDLILPSP